MLNILIFKKSDIRFMKAMFVVYIPLRLTMNSNPLKQKLI